MKFLLYILIACTLFFGCKKYPEDKIFVHLRTPERRIEHLGPWYLDAYTVDGEDSLKQLNTKYYWRTPVENNPWHINEGFEFDKKKNKIRFRVYQEYVPVNYPNYWNVIRLDKQRFIISMNVNGKDYKLVFRN